MRWTPGSQSDDIEDRRDDDSSGSGFGGFGGGGARIGLGGLVVLGVLSVIFRTDLISPFLGGGRVETVTRRAPDPARTASEQKSVQFVSFALDNMQQTWERIFAARGQRYRHAKL